MSQTNGPTDHQSVRLTAPQVTDDLLNRFLSGRMSVGFDLVFDPGVLSVQRLVLVLSYFVFTAVSPSAGDGSSSQNTKGQVVMIYKNFRTYQLAVASYRLFDNVKCAAHLKTQLIRAASSVVLNLAEGAGRQNDRDRKRFYGIAMASHREVQAILELIPHAHSSVVSVADQLAACLYRLCSPKQ